MQDAPSNLASIGRYVLNPQIFRVLRTLETSKNVEMQLTDALDTFARKNLVEGVKLKGERFDCGSIEGFVKATLYMGRKTFSARFVGNNDYEKYLNISKKYDVF